MIAIERKAMEPLAPGSVRLNGRLGDSLRLVIRNRLKKVDYAHLVEPFRSRNEIDGLWRCEFWGKIVRSAVQSWRGEPDPELRSLIETTVRDLLETQDERGCICSYPLARETEDWDLWGRKYVLLGLLWYYREIDPDPRVKEAVVRQIDHLMTQVGPKGKNITACGHHHGLAASSILEPVVLAHRITGEQRFLDYALWIANAGGSNINNIFTDVLKGVPPKELGNGKAYEMMSCFEGLAELYRVTGCPSYKESLIEFYRAVRDREIFITGTGGLKDEWGEFWDDGKARQTRNDAGGLGETCVTATWIKLCGQIVRLTGDCSAADEMERSLYNSVLGAMVPDGSWWVHRNPTPLAGRAAKVRAGDQIPGFGEDCCVAQGPMALAMAPWAAVMRNAGGPVINFYEALDCEFLLGDGSAAKIRIEGDFPRGGHVRISFHLPAPATFELTLRIPSWSRSTRLIAKGRESVIQESGYVGLKETWHSGDVVEIDFDMATRILKSGDGERLALMRGPIVLAQDSRIGQVDRPVFHREGIELEPVSGIPEIFEAYLAEDGTALCDYSSAGNEFSPDNPLCVWMKAKESPGKSDR